jgi:hypothetical protein
MYIDLAFGSNYIETFTMIIFKLGVETLEVELPQRAVGMAVKL